MTAFLQGISQFVPQIQPYQPDLNFFGNMLQTKQYQYDQGYNRINSIYSSLLNSPVLRQESSERRDAFFKSIEKNIQKISTLDLSMEQNVGAAAKVFQPLIDDKDINFDMGMTRIWQRQMQRGESLKNTTDPKALENGMWWEGGDRAMNYWAQDFAKSSSEDMYKMPKPEYTPYLNIAKLATEHLEKMKFPMGINPTWTPDGKYIIQGKGGPMVMAPLYNHLLNIYGNDPRVVKVAQTEAYLKRKDFVAENASALGSEQSAETQYLNNILNQVNTQAKKFQEQASTNAKVTKAKTEVVGNAISSGDMYDPDNTIAELLGGNQEQAAVEEGAAEFHSQTLDITNPEVLKASDFASLRNRADSAVARDILSEKLYNTARDYAELNKEIKIEADPYAKSAFDNALQRSNMLLQAQIDQAKIELQSKLDIAEKEYDYYLKDYYGDGDGSGSGKGKGNNGVDDENPLRLDGWILDMVDEPGGEGKKGDALTSQSIKGLNEVEIARYEEEATPGVTTFNNTVDKLYELATSGDPNSAIIGRKALAELAETVGATQKDVQAMIEGKDFQRIWNVYKDGLTGPLTQKFARGAGEDFEKTGRPSFFTEMPGIRGLDAYNQKEIESEKYWDKVAGKIYEGGLSAFDERVKILQRSLRDPSVVASLNKTDFRVSDVYNTLEDAGKKAALYKKGIEYQAENDKKVWENAILASDPVTKDVGDYRLDVAFVDGKYVAKYSAADPEFEKKLLVQANTMINSRYQQLRQEDPKEDTGDLWKEAQEYGESFYVSRMMDYYKGPGLKQFEQLQKEHYKNYEDYIPLYNAEGRNINTGGKSNSEQRYFNAESDKLSDSDLLNALQGRYDKLSENYRKSWNNVEGLVSLNPTLYNDPKGGGLAIKSWRSDIDGAYFKNPGNAEFRSVYSDFERYVQTHKKNDGSFALFSGKIDPEDDISDVLEKTFDDKAYEMLLQLNLDMSNAGSWKSNQMTRPRALMDAKSLGNGFEAITLRVDGGYVKGLKESASKELSTEEQEAESSSSSLSDARYYTIVAPEGTFGHIENVKREDFDKTYLRLVGPINIDYNNPSMQRFSGNAQLSFDDNSKSYIVQGQFNTLDQNGNVVSDPNGVLDRRLTQEDNITNYRKTVQNFFDQQNAQIIHGLQQLQQNKKKR
jgi:hypothetical protein